MHPGVSYPLERVVPEDGIHICGKYLPAGTIVGVNAAVIHRDKTIFGDDADTFRPERWLDNDIDRIKTMDRHNMTVRCMFPSGGRDSHFAQFGAGTRTCIGKNISIMEMAKFVPQILRQFDLKWASSEPEWKIKTYWFAKQTGLLVRFRARDQGRF